MRPNPPKPSAMPGVAAITQRVAAALGWDHAARRRSRAVKKFEPTIWVYHPHPPGFPLYVLLGKALNELVHDPWVVRVFVWA